MARRISLRLGGYARNLQTEDYHAFLACLPKAVLLQGARAAGHCDVRTSWSKPKLISFFLAQIDFACAHE